MFQGAWLSRPVVSRNGVFFWFLLSIVRVRYTFFLVAALLAARRPLATIPVWIAMAFLGVLVHELGHAWAARWCGGRPTIELHAMGGTTSWEWTRHLRWSERVAIALAGPGLGLVAGGLVFGLASAIESLPQPYLLRVAVADFLWVCLGWGLFNLVPILPLDGGAALEEVLSRRYGADRGRYQARVVSCVAGGIGLALALAANEAWVALLLAAFTWNNIQRMRGLPGIPLPH